MPSLRIRSFSLALALAAALSTAPAAHAQEESDAVTADEQMDEREREEQVLRALNENEETMAAMLGLPPPGLRNITFTSSPASASLSWPQAWAEGDAVHRQAVAALERQPAPPLSDVVWVSGIAASAELAGGAPTVIAFFTSWNSESRDAYQSLLREVRMRDDRGVRLIGVHPDEASEELEELIRLNQGNQLVAMDRGRAARGAYLVDTYPDFFLIGGDGVVLCADVAGEHILEALDAAMQGWVPWEPLAATSATAEASATAEVATE